jgi:hypothetical protein
MAQDTRTDAPPQRLVRHVFWKYPVIAAVVLIVVAVVGAAVGSPNSPPEVIADAARGNPGGTVLSSTQELDGTSPSTANASEYGMGDPAQTLVMKPLRTAAPLLGQVTVQGLPTLQSSDVRRAIVTYHAASADQQRTWASNYEEALGKITPEGGGEMGGAEMEGTKSPDFARIATLQGDFGPVPALTETVLYLAQSGYLEQYFEGVEPGHSYHLTNIWCYDHPDMLNTAVDEGLTDDQWGMVKERGFPVGPWYLFVPAVFHVLFPGGSTGQGFLIWNLLFAALLLFVVPLVPGVRGLPERLKLYRFIYRYPLPGDLESPALRERHGQVHRGPPRDRG